EGKNSRKIEVMRLIVEEKFSQDKYLQDLLLETGDKEIIEDTESKILMEIRDELKKSQGSKPDPNPPPQSPPTNPSQPNAPNGGPNSPNPNPNSPNPP
ncbi:13553_t:CDS:2, partial [Cetraspora pellucida]